MPPAARSGVALRAGDRIEFSIGLGGAAFDVMLATDPRGSAGGPQVDDRHLLDGIAGCVAWSARGLTCLAPPRRRDAGQVRLAGVSYLAARRRR
jgi:hypothetical protein